MRMSRAKKKELQWFQSAVSSWPLSEVTAAATTSFHLDADIWQRKYTLVRLLVWPHWQVEASQAASFLMYMGIYIETEVNGAFALSSPADNDNQEGNRTCLAWQPIHCSPQGASPYGQSTSLWNLFLDIRAGRVIDPAKQKLVCNFRLHPNSGVEAEGFAGLDYRLLWTPT